MPTNLENCSGHRTGKSQLSFQSQRSAFISMPFFENGQTTIQLHSFHMLTSLCSKSFKQYMNQELPDVQAGLQRGRGTRDKIANPHWIMEKVRKFQKNIYLCFIDYTKAFDCIDHNKLWKILKEMGIPDHLTYLLRICRMKKHADQEATVRTLHETMDCFKMGMEYNKAVHCHPVYFTYRQNTLCKMPGLMNRKLESRLPEEISTTSDK